VAFIFSAIRKHFKSTDKLLLVLCIVTSLYGAALVYSATKRDDSIMATAVQLGALVVGLIAAMTISAIDYEDLARLWPVISFIALLLVGLTFVIGVAPEARPTAMRWLKLPGGIFFQPLELVKFAFILTFSFHLHKIKDRLNKFYNVLLLGVHGAVPALLAIRQDDTGSAVLFMLMFAVMMFAAGVQFRYFIAGIIGVAAALPFIWTHVFSQFHRDRIEVLFNQEAIDPNATGIFYHQFQGRIAIGSGEVWGRGFMNGPRVQNGMVPMSYNDFIFATAGEELGYIGCMIIFVLLLAILIKILFVAQRSNSLMGRLICIGVFTQLVVQALLNIGMCLCVAPVIGQTLPFFSAGGSSLLCTFLNIGLVLSVYIYNDNRNFYDDL